MPSAKASQSLPESPAPRLLASSLARRRSAVRFITSCKKSSGIQNSANGWPLRLGSSPQAVG